MQPSKRQPKRLDYEGPFEMAFLLPNERVGAAGDHSGACVIASENPPYEVRIELGERIIRKRDGSLKTRPLYNRKALAERNRLVKWRPRDGR